MPLHTAFLVDGILGSGKSTLLRELVLRSRLENWDWQTGWGEEPLGALTNHPLLPESPSNPLKEFYEGSLSALAFQVHVSHALFARDAALKADLTCGKADLVVMDRCLASARAFQATLVQCGRLSPLEHAIAEQQIQTYETTGSVFNPRDLVLIYLEVEPQVALDRIRNRARTGEEHVTLEYLTALSNAFQARFADFSVVHRIQVGADTRVEEVVRLVSKLVRARRTEHSV